MDDICMYSEEVIDSLKQKHGYTNNLAVPKISKVVLSMGLGKAVSDKKIIQEAVEVLTKISGQMVVVTNAKRSISTFKLREGMPIGCKVTLRKDNMYNFIRKFIYVSLPISRDFKGFSKKQFDGCGNFSCGISDITIFPEIDMGKYDNNFGLNVSVCTTAKTNEEGHTLLSLFDFPFFD